MAASFVGRNVPQTAGEKAVTLSRRYVGGAGDYNLSHKCFFRSRLLPEDYFRIARKSGTGECLAEISLDSRLVTSYWPLGLDRHTLLWFRPRSTYLLLKRT